MSRPRMLQVCALNLDADPHPDGIYVTALNRASEFYVRSRANDWAKVTKPAKIKGEDFFSGRILIWTEIDIQGKWLDTTSEDTLSEALKAKISIPSEAKPNFRTFNYVFKVSNHRLYFESLNEFNEGLGPKTARSMFSRLLSRELLGEKFPDISVTILPNERAVEKVLTLPGLRSLTIRINTPNADASDPEARKRVLDEMRAAKARQRDEHWVKNSEAKTLLPTADIRERATVAAETGFVRGEGRDSNGKKLLAATDDYPQTFFVDNSVGESFFERLKTSLGSLL